MKSRYKSDPYITLSDLKKENRILKSEIKRLNRTLRTYSQAQLPIKRSNFDHPRQIFFAAANEWIILSSTSYPKYLTAKISRASITSLCRRTAGYLRKFKLFSTIMRVIYSAAAIIGTGAFFIFVSSAILFIIPIGLLFCSAIYMSSMLLRKKAFKKLSPIIKNKNVYVAFASHGRQFENGSCFMSTVSMLSKNNNYVIIVSPYFISSKGPGKNIFYPVVRFETNNVCIVRKYAFFALRSHLLSSKGQQVAYIY